MTSESYGVRSPSSVAFPVLVMSCALLLGGRAAWAAALCTALAIPVTLVIGRQHFGGPGIPSQDLPYLMVLEVVLFGAAALLTLFLQTLAILVRGQKASVLRWQKFFENAPDAMVALDPQNQVVGFNRLATLYFELSNTEALDLPLKELKRKLPNCFPSEKESLQFSPVQVQVNTRILETHIRTTQTGAEAGGKLYIFRDVSARERETQKTVTLRSQLNHVQKLSAIGQLAGGVAHDFNNLLTSLSGATFLLRSSKEEEVREIAEELSEVSHHGATLTRQLLKFARRENFNAQIIDIGQAFETARPLIARLLGERITLDIESEMGCNVKLDEGQLEQVLLNFASNARYAIEGIGTFSLNAYLRNDQVSIEIRDTGKGMSPETMAHIFEPFYTTKSSNQGTGLGLATTHGIITQCQGSIGVSSVLNEGTLFTIHWPLAHEEVTGITSSRPSWKHEHKKAKILLVEDNEPARLFLKRILERAGYKVYDSSSAEEALKACHDGLQPKLLVSDVIMPGLTGVDLATRLHKTWPQLPVLFISGYVDDVLNSWPYDTTKDLLLKPFSADALLERVEEKIHAKPTRMTSPKTANLGH